MRPLDLVFRPSCLLGPQCWLSRTESAAFHRRLVMKAWPSESRWRWCLLLGANFCCWYLFLSWASLWRCLQKRRAVAAQSGKRMNARQLWDLFFLAFITGAPPEDYNRYNLCTLGRSSWLDFVFSSEQMSWHRVFSCPLGSTASVLLKDKLQFERFLQEREIPSTQTLFEITPDSEDLDVLFSGRESLFIKPGFANASRGCVCLTGLSGAEEHYSLTGYDWAGKAIELSGRASIEAFIRQLGKDQPLLIQQLLSNSKQMSNYSGTEDLVTVRLITSYNGEEAFAAYGLLEIPVSPEKGWKIYALDLENGCPVLESEGSNPEVSQRFASGIPEFGQLLSLLTNLHVTLYDVVSIGWDICHTENGWTLIEGNTGWNLCIPQAVSGKALLTTRLAEDYAALSH